MTMFTISTIATSIGALAFAGTVATGTAKAPQGHKAKRGGKIERLCRQLECNPQQREQLTAIGKDLRKGLRGNGKAIRLAKSSLADEYRKPSPDVASMNQQYRAIEDNRRAKRAATHEALMKAHALLSPKQRDELAKRIAKRGPQAVFGGKKRAHKKNKAGARGKGQGKSKHRDRPQDKQRNARG